MDDLISRRMAVDALAEAMPSLTTPDGSGQFDRDIQIADEAFVDAMQIINDLPSAEPRRGKWIKRYDEEGFSLGRECSECGKSYVMPDGWANFCPNCGADMRGEDE